MILNDISAVMLCKRYASRWEALGSVFILSNRWRWLIELKNKQCVILDAQRFFHSERKWLAFEDLKVLRCRGGNGGNGAVSYIKHTKKLMQGPGKPSGGAGGNGGAVLIVASSEPSSLSHIDGNANAGPGMKGGKFYSNGAQGRNCLIKVPPGCLIWKLPVPWRDEEELYSGSPDEHATRRPSSNNRHLLADLIETGHTVTVAKGGKGGKGNNEISPHEATKGEYGEEAMIEIELKLIADVGLLGFPNAGKSTLLSAISNAQPKIAPYPFTTRSPNIGAVKYSNGLCITVADLPGIIEGAHLDFGLGIQFLRHIQRTSLLVYVVDISLESPDPFEALMCLRKELYEYNPALVKKAAFVVANKCDIRTEESLEKVDALWKKVQDSSEENLQFFPISARFGYGIDRFLEALRETEERLFLQ